MALQKADGAVYSVEGRKIVVPNNVAGWRVHRASQRGTKLVADRRPVSDPQDGAPFFVDREEVYVETLVEKGHCEPGRYILFPVDDKLDDLDGESAFLEVPATATSANGNTNSTPTSPNDALITALTSAIDGLVKCNTEMGRALSSSQAALASGYGKVKPAKADKESQEAQTTTAAPAASDEDDDDDEKEPEWVGTLVGMAKTLTDEIAPVAKSYLMAKLAPQPTPTPNTGGNGKA